METYREYVGNLHNHSTYSDGTGSHEEIARAAAEAGLNFVIVTDHNVHPRGLEAYHGRTLLLVGEESHNVRRVPQANHLLIYNVERSIAPFTFGAPQTLIRTVRERGGFCYIAHPIERGYAWGDLAAIPWVDWPAPGISGLEIWNYMSEFKGLLWNKVVAMIYAFFPEWGIRGPYRPVLRLWDQLLAQGQRIAALGGADSHAWPYHIGPVTRVLFPYEYLFRCVNTHVLTRGPVTLEAEPDKALIYEALSAGRTWVGYDLPASTRGFHFSARSGATTAYVGEELRRLGATTFQIYLPQRGEIRLLRDGKCIRHTHGAELRYTSIEPGIYRVEVYRSFWGRRVGWIFSSPIYVI